MYARTHIHAMTPVPGVTLRLWQTPRLIVSSLGMRVDTWQSVVVNLARVKLVLLSPWVGSTGVSVTAAVLS
jgi:hypothetical protein